MSLIPERTLTKVFNRTSLKNRNDKVCFSVKNRLAPATLLGVTRIEIDGADVPLTDVTVCCDDAPSRPLAGITVERPVDFPLGTLLSFDMDIDALPTGRHDLTLGFKTRPFGTLRVAVSDELNTGEHAPGTLPRDPENDYGEPIIRARQDFIRNLTGAGLDHVTRYSIDPAQTMGNIEHFTGCAQVPLGFAGPLLVHGQHAQGEFYVPLATSEGTASKCETLLRK